MWLQILINGLIAGAIYALVASGFSLIYSTNKFVHFAHGSVVAFGAYMFYLTFSMFKFDLWVSLILAILLAGGLGYGMNYLIYARLRKKKASPLIQLVASVALLILIESLILLFFGADVKSIDLIKVEKGMEFFDAIITPLQLFIIIVSGVLLAGLYF
ncbi:MAG: branched-chain amino acid ABC transporter permease, partial [Candidatus Diapherotrites archaeon]|nr:branched-chain amino acid ABC transporter permease [Candidatus Diapherotrites archaeon]